jgi:hypothetical protein
MDNPYGNDIVAYDLNTGETAIIEGAKRRDGNREYQLALRFSR